MENFNYINMKFLFLLFYILTPILSFSQIFITGYYSRNKYVHKIVYFTDSLGNEMKNLSLYVSSMDSLVSVNDKLNSLKIEDDGKGFFMLFKNGDKLFLVKSYHVFDDFGTVYRDVLNDQRQYRPFRIGGVASINGVKVYVDSKTPETFFKKVDKVFSFVNRNNNLPVLPFYEYQEFKKTFPKPVIVAIIDL